MKRDTKTVEADYYGRIANQPADPGPGVAEVEEYHRLANRPPDAALSEVDVAFLGQGDRIRALVDERCALLKRAASMDRMIGTLIREHNEARDGEGVRETVLLAKLRGEEAATRRACYLAAALFCVLVIAEGWRVAKWIWGLL